MALSLIIIILLYFGNSSVFVDVVSIFQDGGRDVGNLLPVARFVSAIV